MDAIFEVVCGICIVCCMLYYVYGLPCIMYTVFLDPKNRERVLSILFQRTAEGLCESHGHRIERLVLSMGAIV